VAEKLWILDRVWNSMVEHALREAPLECCGLLAGSEEICAEIYPLVNERKSPVAYAAEPHSLVQAFRSMRARQQELLAIYHSHPTAPAIPSRTDLMENYYGELPRVIISLVTDPPTVRAFVLYEDSFGEIPIERLRDPESQRTTTSVP
jgi:proteasome lid subunit RPN8/RPN11